MSSSFFIVFWFSLKHFILENLKSSEHSPPPHNICYALASSLWTPSHWKMLFNALFRVHDTRSRCCFKRSIKCVLTLYLSKNLKFIYLNNLLKIDVTTYTWILSKEIFFINCINFNVHIWFMYIDLFNVHIWFMYIDLEPHFNLSKM